MQSTTSQRPLSPPTTRKEQFVQLSYEILTDENLNNGDIVFAAHLLRWDWGNGCWLTDKQLALKLKVTERTIRNHSNSLEQAGHLWMFEDREGMTVRLVVRPGHIYPKPKGLGKPLSRKNFSKSEPPYKDVHDFNNIKAHEVTTSSHENLYPVPPTEPLQEDAVKQTPNTPKNLSSPISPTSPRNEPLLHPNIPADPEIIKLLTNAGVARHGAIDLARVYPPIRCWDGIEYVQRRINQDDPIANPGGYIRRAIEEGWGAPSPILKASPDSTHSSYSSSPSYFQHTQSGSSTPATSPIHPELALRSPPRAGEGGSNFAQAQQASPHTKTWHTALSTMRHPANLDSWCPPSVVEALAKSVYISSITDKSVHLTASSVYHAETARKAAAQIQNALHIAGLDIKSIRVTTHPEE